jgi:hypothetical protein
MPFQPPPRLSFVLAGALAAGLVLAVASCSQVTPKGSAPVAHVDTHPPSPLRSPFDLEAVGSQLPTGAGGCLKGSVALSGGPGQCYRRLGKPVMITSAFVGPVITDALHFPGLYGFWVVLPAADVAALRAVTTTAAGAHANLAISVAGRGWLLPIPGRPFTNGQLEIFSPSLNNSLLSRNNEVLELHRILVQHSPSRLSVYPSGTWIWGSSVLVAPCLSVTGASSRGQSGRCRNVPRPTASFGHDLLRLPVGDPSRCLAPDLTRLDQWFSVVL